MTSNQKLDPTNLSILRLLSQGLIYRTLANKIFLSRGAVRKRVEKLKEETGCKNIPELVYYYRKEIEEVKQTA
jgi:DNA-binding CsgD family transcriptional regulator